MYVRISTAALNHFKDISVQENKLLKKFTLWFTSLLHPSLFHNNLYPVGVSSISYGEHSGTQASVVHSTDCSVVC